MKILYVVNHTPFFASHRLVIAKYMRNQGHSVFLSHGISGNEQSDKKTLASVRCAGVRTYSNRIIPDSINPFNELVSFLMILYHLLRIRPDVVQLVSPKCNIYGGLLCRILRKRYICAISGFGFMLTARESPGTFLWLITKVKYFIISMALDSKRCQVIVQNKYDYQLVDNVSKKCEIHTINGSGVDLSEFNFNARDFETKKNYILFPARVLKDKGIIEFAHAAKILAKNYGDWRFLVAGELNYKNPSALSDGERKELSTFPIEFLGHVNDMVPLLRESKIVCLPSYREGMPKVILEASAMGCAVVTTDVPGCNESVIDHVTGLIAKPFDCNDLAAKIRCLLDSPDLLESFSRAGVEHARDNFSVERVLNSHYEIYESSWRDVGRNC